MLEPIRQKLLRQQQRLLAADNSVLQDLLRTELLSTGWSRFFTLGRIALLSSIWLGLVYPLIWFAVSLSVKLIGDRLLIAPIVSRADLRPDIGKLATMVFVTMASIVALVIPAFFSDVQGGAIFALAMIFAGLLRSVIYSSAPLLLISAVAPLLVGLVVAPFAIGPLSLATLGLLITAFLIVQLMFRTLKERNDVLDSAIRSDSARRTAEETNQAKSQFLATVTHELKTPLNAMINYAEMLSEDLDADGKQSEAGDARKIRRAASDLLLMINNVLDFSQLDLDRMQLKIDAFDAAVLIREAVESTHPLAAANGNRISLHIDPNLGLIQSDSTQLRQCLTNLLTNACKFTKNGLIAITARIEAAPDPMLSIAISDTGCGISPEAATRLFQPFTQAESSFTRAHDGLGLGLVVTRRLAALLGGTLSFDSEAGKGSTFVLSIPKTAAPVSPLKRIAA